MTIQNTVFLSKRFSARLAAMLLSLALLAAILLSCAPGSANRTEEPDTTAAAVTTAAEDTGFFLSGQYVIVWHEDTSVFPTEAATLLADALAELTGEKPELVSDWVRRGAEPEPAEYELCVGDVNRSDCEELDYLSCLDSAYFIKNKNTILLYGETDESALCAVNSFLSDIFGYTTAGTGENRELHPSAPVVSQYEYPVSEVSLLGSPLSEWTVVCPTVAGGSYTAAKKFCLNIEKLCGTSPALCDLNTPETDREILLMLDSREARKTAGGFGSFDYRIELRGNTFVLDGTPGTSDELCDAFLALILPDGAETTPDKTSVTFLPGVLYNGTLLEDEYNRPVEQYRVNETELASGITYAEIHYADKTGLPVVAYMCRATAGSYCLRLGTPDDGKSTEPTLQKVRDQTSAAVANGINVICAVNGDFFTYSDMMPRGISVRDGTVVTSDTLTRWFFGSLFDGTPVCGTRAEANDLAGKLETAVGCDPIVLTDGHPDYVYTDDEFGYTRHPRTSAGFTENGDIILLVVDGRNPPYSNGASLTDLAYMMRDLGAVSAVNLDGGGSSTMVLVDENGCRVVNQTSGAERNVANSLQIIVK